MFLSPLLAALAGCNTVVMNPSGDIAKQEAQLIIVSVILMLLIIVPVMFLIIWFAYKYRASNKEAAYEPDWDHSTKLELVIWGAPLLIIIVLGLVTWISTHKLDPYRPLDRIAEGRPIPASAKPLVIQAVAMDWKWLFIYPEQGIATVNELVVPVDVPLRFKVSATSVMNAFYVPELAGMVYGMPGRTSRSSRSASRRTTAARAIPTCASAIAASPRAISTRGCSRPRLPAAASWIARTTSCSKSRASRNRCAVTRPSTTTSIIES
jgi:cytochrome o ubiquinol oxidase subunit II